VSGVRTLAPCIYYAICLPNELSSQWRKLASLTTSNSHCCNSDSNWVFSWIDQYNNLMCEISEHDYKGWMTWMYHWDVKN